MSQASPFVAPALPIRRSDILPLNRVLAAYDELADGTVLTSDTAPQADNSAVEALVIRTDAWAVGVRAPNAALRALVQPDLEDISMAFLVEVALEQQLEQLEGTLGKVVFIDAASADLGYDFRRRFGTEWGDVVMSFDAASLPLAGALIDVLHPVAKADRSLPCPAAFEFAAFELSRGEREALSEGAVILPGLDDMLNWRGTLIVGQTAFDVVVEDGTARFESGATPLPDIACDDRRISLRFEPLAIPLHALRGDTDAFEYDLRRCLSRSRISVFCGRKQIAAARLSRLAGLPAVDIISLTRRPRQEA